MDRFTSFEIFSCALVWLVTSLLRLAADVMRKMEAAKGKGQPYKPGFWRVLFHLTSTAVVAFLAAQWLHEVTWGYGKRMLALFLATFLAPAIIDALLLVNGRMLLAEFAKYVAAKTGAAVSLAPEEGTNSSPTTPTQDEAATDTP